ncbi:MAG: hypothetical protein OEV00_14665 [Acidobacteriota bacterium]|nr:hypothetical protein [Acidobacteriota bacterium]MDH3786552.1 hypothetical protein [Acidobacteriota bacterium]
MKGFCQVVFGMLLIAVLCTGPALAEVASSPSYVLQQTAVDGAGTESSSGSYVMNGAAVQKATIGTSASPAYVLQSGFFSYLGSGLVPVVLTVDKDAIDPQDIDLSWSGNNDPYSVYRSIDCTAIIGGFLAQVNTNDYDDDTVGTTGLNCYRVFATAPGPAPPGGAP